MTGGPVAIIAAVAENGVIGRDNDLPWRISSDMAFFKKLTLGHTLVMGRRTYASIGRPLPGRRTIVVTSSPIAGLAGDVETAAGLGEAIAMAHGPVFLAGGAGIYAEGLGMADTLHLTRVHAAPDGDTMFPAFDGFVLAKSEPGVRGEKDAHDFTFETWVRGSGTV